MDAEAGRELDSLRAVQAPGLASQAPWMGFETPHMDLLQKVGCHHSKAVIR